MKRLRTLLIVVGAIALLGIGFFVFRGPQPEIIIPAEEIFKVGGIKITNTIITAWASIIVLVVVGYFAGRSVKLIPRGAQNLVEAFFDFVYGQVENIAGPQMARRIFPIIFTFFIYILISNWMGLLPFFNQIGFTEDIGHETIHEIEEVQHREDEGECAGPAASEEACENGRAVFEEKADHRGTITKKSGFAFIGLGPREFEIDIPQGSTAEEATAIMLASFIDYEVFADVDDLPEEYHRPEGVSKGEDVDRPVIQELIADYEGHPDETLEALVTRMQAEGVEVDEDNRVVLLVPLFRSVMSDLNATLALGLVAFVMIEFWGVSTVGRSYFGKFFNLKGVNSFVGVLELLSEFIRIISFGFRLFGNIFAGEVLLLMMTFLVPFVFVSIFYGLELFVGFIQAAVFALLTTVFAVMAMTPHHEGEHEEGHGEEGHAPQAGGH